MKRNEKVDPNEVKFRHMRHIHINYSSGDKSIYNLGGTTIAYRELTTNTIIFAVARCSWEDNYCKKTGRNISAGRLKSEKHSYVANLSISEFHKIVNDSYITDITRNLVNAQ